MFASSTTTSLTDGFHSEPQIFGGRHFSTWATYIVCMCEKSNLSAWTMVHLPQSFLTASSSKQAVDNMATYTSYARTACLDTFTYKQFLIQNRDDALLSCRFEWVLHIKCCISAHRLHYVCILLLLRCGSRLFCQHWWWITNYKPAVVWFMFSIE